MVGWHHRLDRLHEFEQILRNRERQGSLRAAAHGVIKSWTQLSNQTTALWNLGRARETEHYFLQIRHRGLRGAFVPGKALQCLAWFLSPLS